MTHRFLIVDDEPAAVRMLEWVIEERGVGAVAGTATDGLSGERAALSLRPDVVLLDLLMPGQDGLEMMQSLKQKGFNGAFVMISQVTAKDLVGSAYDLGAEYFIHKPLHLPEVLAVLNRVSESLRLRSALQSVQASLAPLAGRTASSGESLRRTARSLLADLGILGEAGGADLTLIPALPGFGLLRSGRYELNQIYTMLAEHYQTKAPEGKAPGAKAVEQRIRRAAAAGQVHMAALGLEDYNDPRFERLAATFFDFTEVRQEMVRLKSGKGSGGRVNLKKFLDAFLLAMENG